MRAHLFSTSTERRPRRPRRGPARRPAEPREHETRAPSRAMPAPDLAVERVQHAGGPLDAASYACSCGYMFVAPVSTTVSCPHCGCDQAW